MTDWDKIIKNLNTNHLYKIKKIVSDKKGITGLEVFADGLNAMRRMEICKEICPDKKITHFPNEDKIIIEPIHLKE